MRNTQVAAISRRLWEVVVDSALLWSCIIVGQVPLLVAGVMDHCLWLKLHYV